MTDSAFRSGFVAILGRPNVGKSTLVNRLVGSKVSIVSAKPQTTRHRILGVHTDDSAQVIYIDTPGIDEQSGSMMKRIMNRAARSSAGDADCTVLVITAEGWRQGDRVALAVARASSSPLLLAVNKIDRLPERTALLPLIEQSAREAPFEEIVPVSARTGLQIDQLSRAVRERMPVHPPYFDADQTTDRSESFRAGEFVREQLFHALGAEVPYATAIEIEEFGRDPQGLLRIRAVIWVEKDGQKGIVIGKDGRILKEVGRRARLGMQEAFGAKVFLGLWVKVRAGWSDDERALNRLGYWEG
ncbi:MAG: GTPase Era [Acidiferrobacteraceae bacterium]